MTEDFKKKILDWLSGNYTVQSGNNVPQFSETESEFNDLKDTLDTLFPHNYFLDGYLQTYDVSGDGLKYTVAYGEYNPTASSTLDQRKGFILILDDDFTLIQTITKYSSGTDFGVFLKMNVGDDGNFFAIEQVSGGTKRFVMLNNIIAKLPNESNYKVVLKKSYSLQGASANLDPYMQLIKAPGQSRYLIVGSDYDTGYIKATELVINVGMSNEWNDYSYNNNDFGYVDDVYANWTTQGALTFKLAGFWFSYDGDYPVGKFSELSGSSGNVGTMTLTKYGQDFNFSLVFAYYVKIISSTEAYFSVSYKPSEDATNGLEDLFHFNNGTINKIYSLESTTGSGAYDTMELYRVNNEIFFLARYSQGTIPNITYYLRIGKVIGENVYTKVIYQDEDDIEYMFFTVQKQFNLYNYYVQMNTDVQKTSQVYSSGDYNGQPYQALNSMIPNSAELSSYQVPVFARDLYNRFINSNTTISIINVPNSYINEIDITNEKLYGETNSTLVDQNDIFSTNIYEELMVNFVNTLLMRNENDSNNIIDNLAGAIRLNKSISSLLDYDNCKITKYKINYIDGTNVIKVLSSGNVSFQNSKTQYLISFYNDEEKQIKNIQLISDDESTTYQTIDLRNLGVNKYYAITQDLKVV